MELLPLETAMSNIWTVFGFPASGGEMKEPDKKRRKKVYCKLCSKGLSYVGNTTNMWNHLEDCHPGEHRHLKRENCDTPVKSERQPTLKESLAASQPLPRSSERWRESVTYCIAKDCRPYDTVNDAGFCKMLNVFEPRYTVPDRKTIATHYVPQLYDKERARIEARVSTIDKFSLTTDIWSSRANHSYIGVTIHFIDEEFQLCHHLLETLEFSDSHTGQNIGEQLTSTLQTWSLSEENLVATTTDNGSNVVLALSVLDWLRMPCFSHSLQLAVEATKGIKAVHSSISSSM